MIGAVVMLYPLYWPVHLATIVTTFWLYRYWRRPGEVWEDHPKKKALRFWAALEAIGFVGYALAVKAGLIRLNC